MEPARLLARFPSGNEDSVRLAPLDLCCPPRETRAAAPRRARLADLDMHIHCSVIGTCLSTSELRKLVPKFAPLDRERATDLEIHHTAVELAVQGGAGAKALHKALDQRYAGAIRLFGAAKTGDDLRRLWRDALKSGDVPPAYWAIMTHPEATLEIRQLAFGDVHMLSHLVGAANRADIRRLVALEEENAELKGKIERQQSRLQSFAMERDAALREQQAAAQRLADLANARAAHADEDVQTELERLRRMLSERDASALLHASRCDVAEGRLREESARVQALQAQLDDALATIDAIRREADAIEQTLLQSGAPEDGAHHAGLAALGGRRIVYVGGRPGSNAAIRRLVEAAGGTLVVHDGGIEDRKGLLAAAIPGADLVVFPVDCIDHDSMNTLKRLCERHTIAWRPLRTASVASFVASVGFDANAQAERPRAPAAAASRPPAFCMRHG